MNLVTDILTVSQRVDAARAKIESLNPMVTIETVASLAPLEPQNLLVTLQNVDLICVTDSDRDTLASPFCYGTYY